MKIMTFNLLCYGKENHFWADRAPDVIDLINREKPDSFGVQEATKKWMDTLSAGLTDYDFVGVGREDGKDEGEFSAVFFLKDKFTKGESDTFWISETPDVPSKGWDGACTRICTYVYLTEKSTGKSYVHMNTHLDHVGRIAQINGAEMIKKKAMSFGGVPVLCTGDFNVEQGSDCYNCMVSENMGDSKFLAEDTEDCYTFHGFDPDNIHVIIDFIFVDKTTIKVRKYHVLNERPGGRFYSDHNAVVAEIDF